MEKKFLHCSSCEDKKWHDRIMALNYRCRECEKITHLSKLKTEEKKHKDKLKTDKGKSIEREKKEKREVDEGYLAFIRRLPCLIMNERCFGIIHAHHHDRKSQLGSDYSAVPLCFYHHNQLHAMGVDSFANKNRLDMLQHIKRLNLLYRLKNPKS